MKKLLALMMAVLMIAGIMTVPAFAAGEYLYDADMEGVAYTESAGRWILDTYADGNRIDGAQTDESPAIYDVSLDEGSSGNAQIVAGYYQKQPLYKMIIPEIPVGKVLKSAEFRMTSYYYNAAREMKYAYVLPGEGWETSGLTIGEAKEIIKCTEQSSSGSPTGDYYYGPVTAGGEMYKDASCYRNKLDVTELVSDCIENEQDYLYISVTRNNLVRMLSDEKNYPARLYYTLEDAPALTVESSVPESDETAVYPIGKASVTFSNAIKSDITISGNSVSVAFNLGLSAATELTVNATDPYSQTVSHTISFTTDSKYKFYDDSDMAGVDYILADDSWILTYDASATDTSVAAAVSASDGKTIGYGKYAVVYRVKLPEVPEGKTIATAEFRATSQYKVDEAREMQYAYKMPGQDWNMDTITIADAQKIIDSNNLGTGNNYIGSCTKDASYINGKDYRNKYSVSEYVAECIANDQEYMYIALTRPSSMVNIYAHNNSSSNRKPKLFFTLKDVPVIKGAKVVSADSEAAYADATDIVPSVGDSIKAIAYMINNTKTDVSLNVGVAQYKDGELVALSFVPYILAAGTDASTIEFGATTVETDVDTIKAIIWDTSDNPVIKAKILDVK